MIERIEVLRDIAKEMGIPVAPTCTEVDIQRIILQERVMEDRGDDDCFAYLFQDGDQECKKCEIVDICKRICTTEPSPTDESMKGVKWVNPNLTSFGFNRGTQGHAVAVLLKEQPRTTDEIHQYLIDNFSSTKEKASQMWNYIKDKLRENGFAVTYDQKTKLNTLIDKTESEIDRRVEEITRKGKATDERDVSATG